MTAASCGGARSRSQQLGQRHRGRSPGFRQDGAPSPRRSRRPAPPARSPARLPGRCGPARPGAPGCLALLLGAARRAPAAAASCASVRSSFASVRLACCSARESRLELGRAALGGGRRVVQLVGHPGAEPAQGGQLLALAQHHLLLQVGLLQVAQLLLLQAGVQAGAQQHRVEGLGQVVLGAHLDAAHHAVDLVHGRDDDDRDIAQLGVALDALEHLVAVHARHDDVEQHDVEAARPSACPAPAGRIFGQADRVALLLQARCDSFSRFMRLSSTTRMWPCSSAIVSRCPFAAQPAISVAAQHVLPARLPRGYVSRLGSAASLLGRARPGAPDLRACGLQLLAQLGEGAARQSRRRCDFRLWATRRTPAASPVRQAAAQLGQQLGSILQEGVDQQSPGWRNRRPASSAGCPARPGPARQPCAAVTGCRIPRFGFQATVPACWLDRLPIQRAGWR